MLGTLAYELALTSGKLVTFDEAWPFVAVRTHDYVSMLVRRERLANIVLDLGIKGERDVQKLKSLDLRRLDEMDGVKVDQLH